MKQYIVQYISDQNKQMTFFLKDGSTRRIKVKEWTSFLSPLFVTNRGFHLKFELVPIITGINVILILAVCHYYT